MTALPLADLQRWMSIVVQHPADADAAFRARSATRYVPAGAARAGGVVQANDRMTPAQRLQVYNGAYLARLLEVLESDFPALRHAAGPGAFHDLVHAYLARCPSGHPNLNRLGARLPGWLARRRALPHRAFLADLARLERAVSESFDAPEFTPLDLAALAGWSQEQWAGARLELNPSVHLLAFRHPADHYYQAFRDDEQPAIPAAEPSWLAVYRKDDRVWRLRLSRARFRVLGALRDGEPLSSALARAGGTDDVGPWFQEWAADGLFARARPPG